MKVLTLHQPWAYLVSINAKRFETRSWRTNYRGLVAIHAGRDMDPVMSVLSNECDKEPHYKAPFERYLKPDYAWLFGELSYGGIVAIVELTGCCAAHSLAEHLRAEAARSSDPAFRARVEEELAFGNFSPGRWAWDLRPIVDTNNSSWLVRGYQGLWNLQPADELRLFSACAASGIYPRRQQSLLEAA
jgi:activating signal cointegrator 1